MEWLAAALAGALLGLAIGYVLWAAALGRARGHHAALVIEHGKAGVALATSTAELAAERARADTLAGVRDDRDRIAGELAGLKAGSGAREAALAEQAAALKAQFETLAKAALQDSQAHFRDLAKVALEEHRATADAGLKELLNPVSETLKRYEDGLKGFELRREQAYGSITEQLTSVSAGQARVGEEASKLVSALRSSSKTSGRWGEQQLRNVLEMGGLRDGIDFVLQPSVTTEEGSRRPDAIINLPGGRKLIVDSKCSLEDYLRASESDEAGRQDALRRHAAAVRTHIRALGDKAYWKEFGRSADFVVMFLAGENFLAAALEQDLRLLDEAFQRRVLLAGPTNLLAIAKIVALVWQQETLAAQAREIGELGADLYASIATMAEHVECVGVHLGKAVGFHNKMVGSLETNVLPKARRLPELGVDKGKKAVPELVPIDIECRLAVAPELKLARIAAE